MAETEEARTLSVYINRAPRDVYAFVAVPENLSQWASGLGTAIVRVGDAWVVETEQGPARVRFTEVNRFGVLDHFVTPPGLDEVYIPLRAIAHGNGTQLLFTLLRQPGWSDEQFRQDAASVERDLCALKALLEA